MSSAVSVVNGSSTSPKAQKEQCHLLRLQKTYNLEKCHFHPDKKSVLEIQPCQLLVEEIAKFYDHEIEGLVKGRSRPFNNVIQFHRLEEKEVKLFCAPLAFYVKNNHIQVEMAHAECFCRHIFIVDKKEFYNIIRDSKLPSLDIQIDNNSFDMFEFLAFTLPGVWCRELKTLNVVFNKEVYYEPLATLLKKSRNLSRLRISHNTGAHVVASRLISNLGFLEELELNCSDYTGSGYLLDIPAMNFIVEQEKKTGGTKPFRSLKVFNASFEFNAEQFVAGCRQIARLPHNQTYEDYDSINEIRGRGGIDLDLPENAINFEITPMIPVKLVDKLFEEVMRFSKSFLLDMSTTNPIPRYFLMHNCMFRLWDHN